MVVVCTGNAVNPASFVREELREFSRLGRKIIPVDAGWFALLRSDEELWTRIGGEAPEPETVEAIEKGEPSENVISGVVKAIEFTTQIQRLQRAVWATLALIAVSIGGSLVYSVRTVRSAQARVATANGLADRATLQAASAERERDLAVKDTEEQRRASQLAREAAEAAQAAEREADDRRKAAVIERLSAEASLRASSGSDLQLAITLATEALRRKPSELNAYQVLQDSLFLVRREVVHRSIPDAGVADVAFLQDRPISRTFRPVRNSNDCRCEHRQRAAEGFAVGQLPIKRQRGLRSVRHGIESECSTAAKHWPKPAGAPLTRFRPAVS